MAQPARVFPLNKEANPMGAGSGAACNAAVKDKTKEKKISLVFIMFTFEGKVVKDSGRSFYGPHDDVAPTLASMGGE